MNQLKSLMDKSIWSTTSFVGRPHNCVMVYMKDSLVWWKICNNIPHELRLCVIMSYIYFLMYLTW
jgi:hypothetical protein